MASTFDEPFPDCPSLLDAACHPLFATCVEYDTEPAMPSSLAEIAVTAMPFPVVPETPPLVYPCHEPLTYERDRSFASLPDANGSVDAWSLAAG